jgi:hypothetical protein
VCQRRSTVLDAELERGVRLDRSEMLDLDPAAVQIAAQEAVGRAPARQLQIARAVGDPRAADHARRRRDLRPARPSHRSHRVAEQSLGGQDPRVDVQVVSRAAHRLVLGARRAPLLPRVEIRPAWADGVLRRGDAFVSDEIHQG